MLKNKNEEQERKPKKEGREKRKERKKGTSLLHILFDAWGRDLSRYLMLDKTTETVWRSSFRKVRRPIRKLAMQPRRMIH